MQLDLWGLSPFQQFLLGFFLFILFGAIGSTLEWCFPARSPRASLKQVYFGSDSLVLIGVLGAGVLLQEFQLKLTEFLADVGLVSLVHAEATWRSVLISFFLVFGVLDFVMYWLHRAMHFRVLWPIHRWHHSIERVNGLSGVRLSLFELLINSVPPYLLYLIWPETLSWGLVYFFYTNIFIHLNLKINSPKIARWLVLPRYHRIHHAVQSDFYNTNFSILWTFWDRIFGTYLNPDEISDEFTMGIETKKNTKPTKTWKMAIGI